MNLLAFQRPQLAPARLFCWQILRTPAAAGRVYAGSIRRWLTDAGSVYVLREFSRNSAGRNVIFHEPGYANEAGKFSVNGAYLTYNTLHALPAGTNTVISPLRH